MTVTGMIEIALRNSFCELMEQHFGHPDWLTAPPATFQWLPVEKEKIRLAEANARKAMNARRSHVARSGIKSRAVAQGELAQVRAISGRTPLEVSRADVAVKLEVLYQNRNRVAHHEPVHGRRLHQALQAIDFLVSEFGESNDAGKRYLACLVDRDIRRLRDDARILQATIAGFRK